MTPCSADLPRIDPATEFPGPVVVLAPHSDDEALGCGGTMAMLAPNTPVHVAYATDGRLSPSSPDGGAVPDADGLVETRREEARNATAMLGVPSENLHFLDFPDGGITEAQVALEAALADLFGKLEPRTVFAPFRHDQHPDHLAAHRAARNALARAPQARLVQYFVYYRYPFIGNPDIRQAVDQRHRLQVDIGAVRQAKRRALDLYLSQVTALYPWQSRPVLTPQILDAHCAGDEIFAAFDRGLSDRELFAKRSPRFWAGLRFGPRAVQLKKRYIG